MAVKRGTTRGFLESVNKWTLETQERSEAAFRDGCLDFYQELRNATPVDTGNLRDAWVASNKSGSEIQGPTGPENNGILTSGVNESLGTIASLKIGEKVNFFNRATYFLRIERGFTGTDTLGRHINQAGRWFARRVGSRYKSIMRAAATRNRMRMK